MPVITNQMQWETVAVPVTKGVDLTTRHRLIDPDKLAKAENVFYSKFGGPEKRRGHKAFRLYNDFMDYRGNAPNSNLYGYGLIDLDTTLPTGACIYPQSGVIKDILTYDNREIAWDGWRFFEPTEPGVSGKSKVVNATMPVYKSFQTAKTQNKQDFACSSENAGIRVVAYIEITGTSPVNNAYVKVYNTETNTLKFTAHLNHGSNDPKYVRTVSCGDYCHVLVNDLTDELVYCYSIHQDDNEITRITTAVPADNTFSCPFDVWKFDETKFLVGSVNTNIILTWFNANGIVNTSTLSQNFSAITSGTPINLSLCVHPVTREIAVFFATATPAQLYQSYTEYGVAIGASVAVDTSASLFHLAIAPSYIDDLFHLFYDTDNGTTKTVVHKTFKGSTLNSTVVRYNLRLASRACRVGDVPFIWATSATTYQTTYFLLDNQLLPVVKSELGTAIISSEFYWLPSMDSTVSSDGTWNTTRFTGALLYNERIDIDIGGTGTTFSHKAIKHYELEFSPNKLSYDQAGKALYIAAGQVWSYDGDVLREANFGNGVEAITVATSNGAGALTNSGVYRWRIDICYKNAQNEECRANSFLTDEITMGVADDTAVLTFNQPPTRITDAYYLIFRNENHGTLWYLVSSRVSPIRYVTGAATAAFTDLLADTAILNKELHPAQDSNYLQTFAAPACELITFGQNRLWVAGGELLPGELWPSRLFYPGQVPAYNFALSVQIDRTTEPITALAFQSDFGVVFKTGTTYLVTGNASPNIYQPIFPNVQLALADRGCINHKSIARLYNGIVFQSTNGYKVIGAAGAMDDIGFPVETVRGSCVGAVLVKYDEHIRFYQSDEATLTFDYRDKAWTTFNFNTKPSAAVYSNRTGYAVIARNNELLYETPDYYKDGDFDFHYIIKTAPLAKQIGGFQRIRRVYCIGEKIGIPPAVTIRVYQDGHDYWTSQVRWDYSDDLATSTIGQGTIGGGFIGAPTLDEFKDDIWKFRYRLEDKHQKCENVAVELTDKGRINTSAWIPVAFGLEIGTKTGLDRLANRTITVE